MAQKNNKSNPRRRKHFRLWIKSLSWSLLISVLPSTAFLAFSYYQAIARHHNVMESTVEEATVKVERLLEAADIELSRLAADIEDPTHPESLNLLRRTVYNDPRFREAGIIDEQGLLILTSLGSVEPPIPIPAENRSNPANQSLQVIGPSQTQVMQERSLILSRPTQGQGEVNLLVDPNILAYYFDALNEVHLGPDGYIAYFLADGTLLEADGHPPQNVSILDSEETGRLTIQRSSMDGEFIIVGSVATAWVLHHWKYQVFFGIPLIIGSSVLVTFLFVRLFGLLEGLDGDLKLALRHHEFEIHYQPILDLPSGRCIGCEALMRWRHPEEGMLRPDLFIPLAEKTGFIIPLGEWAISQVLKDCQRLFDRFPGFYVSINLSPIQINFDSLNRAVKPIIHTSRTNQSSLVFEVTESKLVDNTNTISPDTIARLRSLGFKIALDDFGTGYSSLQYLQSFDFDYLKIDRLFVESINRADRTGILLDTLIEIGHKLELTIIAEGIETEEQKQALIQRGVRYGQGWLYSRPLPLNYFERFLQENNEVS